MGCATESPPVTPPPTIKNIEFNQRMVPANDDKQALVAAFTLPGVGDYRSITVSFERNGKKVSDISTYAVNFYDDAGRKELHVKITAYDRTVKNVADYRYFVAGTLSVLGPP
jgi:hypothetical protein